jgi:hypothetical protein
MPRDFTEGDVKGAVSKKVVGVFSKKTFSSIGA